MPLTRAKKEELLNYLRERISEERDFFLVGFKGLNTEEMNLVRKRLRENGGEMKVVKNRLLLRILKERKLESLSSYVEGPTAIVYGDGDNQKIVKVLAELSQELTPFSIQGAWMERRVLNKEEIERYSRLPSREVLVTQALLLFSQPLYRLHFVLKGLISSLSFLLGELLEKKKLEGGKNGQKETQ